MKSRPALIVVVAVILGLLLPPNAQAFTDLPPGFHDESVVGDIGTPTAFDWLPASENNDPANTLDLLITSQEGRLFRWDGAGPAVEVLNLVDTICSGGEMGLLGVAVDPAFSSGARFIYLYYTDRRGDGGCDEVNRANRVSRFTMDANDSIGNEQVLIDNIPSPGGTHNAGDLQFGKDGLLYISVGDGGRDLITGEFQDGNGNARRLDLLNGKILRITSDGGIPAGNPFQGDGTARCSDTGGATSEVKAAKKKNKKKSKKKRGSKSKKQRKREKKREKKQRKRQRKRGQDQNQGPTFGPVCQEIFATGLRNPFRIAFDPDDNQGPQRFFINDVGGGAWEEISEGGSGADYGWNVREGPCPLGAHTCPFEDTEFVEPLFAYGHQSSGCSSITGGTFVPDVPEDSDWTDYEHLYLFADYTCGKIFALDPVAPGNFGDPPQEFATGMGDFEGAIHLAFGPGPDPDLYYTTFANGGQVRKIEFTENQ